MRMLQKPFCLQTGMYMRSDPKFMGATGTIRIFIRIDTLIHISGFIHKFYEEDESVSNS